MKKLYPFVYRGVLTQESLDKAGRKSRYSFGSKEMELIRSKLFLEMLDDEGIATARRMSIVYMAVHAFEKTVRNCVRSAMVEEYKDEWWDKVPSRIKTKVTSRIEDESKFRWHGARGGSEIEYCDFGDLSSIIANNWEIFKDVLADLEWVKATLSILERSRNIVMHGGELDIQDIERIGSNIRDWVRQAG
ncbi:MAG: hypothetical protein IH840_14975 [Candidatus Heimdallarchaeota archaeon]|nr:hypothetical protein [Candidatus Heimdallarchaeota archaeon]